MTKTKVQLNAETLKKAMWLYCDVAYFKESVPDKVIDKSSFSIDDDIETVLTSKKVVETHQVDDESHIEKFWIRMGNDFYPHMKICITRLPGKNGAPNNNFVCSVDTHDQHVLSILPPGSDDKRAFMGIHRKNMQLKFKIERRWKREGVPTEHGLLEDEHVAIIPNRAQLPRRTVLIADDESHIRMALIEILNLFNCDPLVAENGQEALDLAHEHRDKISFAIFDIMMPDVTGLEVVEQLQREQNLTFPYVFLSGMPQKHADPRNEHDFMAKPFTKSLLIQKIKNIITQLNGKQMK